MIDDTFMILGGAAVMYLLGCFLDAFVASYKDRQREKRYQADMEAEQRMRKHYEEAIGQPIAWEPITDPLDLRHLEVKHVPYKGE